MNKQLFYHQQGFNLAELMITIAIIGIGLALTIPSFTSLTRANQLSTQASEIQTALNFARSEAIRLNDRVVFCHSNNQSTCTQPPDTGWQGWIVRRAGATIGAETGDVLRQNVIDSAAVSVKSDTTFSGAQHSIVYNPQGLARVFGSSAPLSAQIFVCIPDPSMAENLFQVRFQSGGRSEIVRVKNDGACP